MAEHTHTGPNERYRTGWILTPPLGEQAAHATNPVERSKQLNATRPTDLGMEAVKLQNAHGR